MENEIKVTSGITREEFENEITVLRSKGYEPIYDTFRVNEHIEDSSLYTLIYSILMIKKLSKEMKE